VIWQHGERKAASFRSIIYSLQSHLKDVGFYNYCRENSANEVAACLKANKSDKARKTMHAKH